MMELHFTAPGPANGRAAWSPRGSIGVASAEADWIFTDKPAHSGIIVPRPVVVEPGQTVVFPPGVLKRIREGRVRRGYRTEGVVRVLGHDIARPVPDRDGVQMSCQRRLARLWLASHSAAARLASVESHLPCFWQTAFCLS